MLLKALATVAAACAVGVAVFLVGFAPRPGVPNQPIEFSHKLHAGEFEIGCLYCHINARRSTVAGIPSMQLCMGCHKNVAKNDEGVKKLSAAWFKGRAIEWIKINDLPDFVHFTHTRHVKADVACQKCHGPVETMDRVKPGEPFTMERCVDCHLQHEASIDCWTCHK